MANGRMSGLPGIEAPTSRSTRGVAALLFAIAGAALAILAAEGALRMWVSHRGTLLDRARYTYSAGEIERALSRLTGEPYVMYGLTPGESSVMSPEPTKLYSDSRLTTHNSQPTYLATTSRARPR